MERNDDEKRIATKVEIIALSIFAITMANGCRDLIASSSTPETFAGAVEEFRKKTIREVESAVGEGVGIQDEANAMRRAREHVEAVCAGWLGGGGTKD